MKRVDELTGLRAIAVFTVILGHSRGFLPGWAGFAYSPALLLGNGEVGVDVFFVLSGFLITSLLDAEYAKTGRIDFWGFYRRRLLRISPAYYVFLLVMAALAAASLLRINWQEFTVAAFYLWNYAHLLHIDASFAAAPEGLWYLGHSWSLALEEQFYWLWPAALLPMLRSRVKWPLPVAILCVPLASMATYVLFPRLREQNGIMFHTAGDYILAGCFLALYRDMLAERFSRLAQSRILLLLLPIFLLAILPNLVGRFGGYWNASYGRTINAGLIVLLLLCMLSQPHHWFCRLLRTRAFVFVGTISYSLYLWQQLFCRAGSPVFFGFPGNIASTLIAATLSYTLVERPFLRLKDHLSRARVLEHGRLG